MVLYTDGLGHYFRYADGVKPPAYLKRVEPEKVESKNDSVKPASKQVKRTSKK